MSCCGKVQHQPLHVAAAVPAVQPNPKHKALWEKLGLDGALYDQNVVFAEFLFETKLLFSIVGYQKTLGMPAAAGIEIHDGQPCIMIQNQWRDFAWIQANLEYDKVQEWMYTKGVPEQIYTYVSPRLGGLILQSRHYYEVAYPVHRLDAAELAALRAHAGALDETGAIYQLVSTPRPSFNDWIVPVHISERVITSDGTVYSFGGQPDPSLAAFIAPPGSSGYSQFCNGASTGKGVIAMADYEEFRPFDGGERLVTSFPITADKAIEVLQIIDQHKQDELRFNLLHQNCAKVGVELTENATGIRINNKVTGSEVLSHLIPEIPLLSTAWKAMKAAAGKFWDCLPGFITVPLVFVATLVFYIPNKIITFLTNLLILMLGGARQADDLAPPNDDPNNQQEMTQFSRLIRDFTDLFRDHPSDIYHHVPVIEWQRQQPTTVSYQYGGPKMYMLPPAPAIPADAIMV